MEHIFDPFYTTKEIGKGTGLGLASVYGIVKSHGGQINCYSELGQGAVFKIYWPALADLDEVVEFNLAELSPSRGGRETILIVDDEEHIRDFASTVLKKYEYFVLTASSGEEALSTYLNHESPIDLVILDIGMPGMGGHRCFKEILAHDPSATVLITSGYSMDGQLKKTLDAGARGYVSKPYNVTELLDKIRQILDGAPDRDDES